MLRHNLLIAIRNFRKYKMSFLINLLGLASGLCCAMLIALWIDDEQRVDAFHTAGPRLLQVMERQLENGSINVTTSTPGPLAPTLLDELPEVAHAATVSWTDDYTLTNGDINVKATGLYAGADFFNIFSFTLLHGNAQSALVDKSSIVISDALATRLFGSTASAAGQSIVFEHGKIFQVAAVFASVPATSTLQFEFVLGYEAMMEAHPWAREWTNNAPATFVVLRAGTSAEAFGNKITNFVKDHGGEANITLFATPFQRLYLHGHFENGETAGGRIAYVRMFGIIAVFIVGMACINFMNLATARAARRLKEIGTKKAMGAARRSLVVQYLTESVLLVLTGFVAAVGAVVIVLPVFNVITGKQLAIPANAFTWLLWSGIAMTTGVLAGSYPAFYLSGFAPAGMLKGKQPGTVGELWMRRGLVVFQFVCAVVLIVSVTVVYRQLEYTQTKNLGFNKDRLLYFNADGAMSKNLETVINTVSNFAGVRGASSIGHGLVEGKASSSTSGMQWEGKDPELVVEMENVRVNYGMMELLGVQLTAGRYYAREYGADDQKIIFNQAAVDAMGMKEPIGKKVTLWGKERQIVGVVKDFHFRSFHEKVKPLFFNLAPDGTWMVMMKVEPGQEANVIAQLEKFYKAYNPGFLLTYSFLDRDYQAQYVAERRVSSLARYFAALATMISCLGLLGLAAFAAERRMKEIGVRKIFGAGTGNIVWLLGRDFTPMVGAGVVVGMVVGYMLCKQWLDAYAYRVHLVWWHFIAAGAATIFVAWTTVALHTWRAARSNPINVLRST